MKLMKKSKLKCPDCGGQTSLYFHTELTIIFSKSNNKSKCSSYGKFAYLTYHLSHEKYGEVIRKVAWNQRGIKDNKPNEFIGTDFEVTILNGLDIWLSEDDDQFIGWDTQV